MTYEVIKLIAPGCWAAYLINGDASGISPEDIRAADNWIAREGIGPPVDCEPYGFCGHWHHAWEEMPLGADCEEYVFLVPRSSV